MSWSMDGSLLSVGNKNTTSINTDRYSINEADTPAKKETYPGSADEIDDGPSDILVPTSPFGWDSIEQRAEHVSCFAHWIHVTWNDYRLDQPDDTFKRLDTQLTARIDAHHSDVESTELSG
ncbi:hypothetical protein VTO58DRAFT_101806 [Aureobasidium pullulans]